MHREGVACRTGRLVHVQTGGERHTRPSTPGRQRIARVAGLLLLAVVTLLPATAAAGTTPTVLVDPRDGAPAGADVTLDGSGFLPGERITADFVGHQFGPVFADDAGAFQLVLTVPDAPVGTHPLDVQGDLGSVVDLDYAIVAAPPSTTTTSPSTSTAPAAPTQPGAVVPTTSVLPPTTARESSTPGTDEASGDDGRRDDERSTDDGDAASSGGVPGWLVPALLVALVVAAIVAAVRFFPSPRPAVPGPCLDLAEKLERLRRWRDRLRGRQGAWKKDAAARRAKADRFRTRNQRVIEAEKAAAKSATSGSTPKAWEAERLEEQAKQAEEMRDQGKESLRSADERIKALEKELQECIEHPPPAPAASAPTDDKDAGCCTSGTWAGLVVVNGGTVGAGASGGFVFLWCVSDSDRNAKLRFTGMRLGPAIGGEFASVSLIGITGVKHPRDLPPAVSAVLDGFDWDLSVGAPLSRIAKVGKGVGKRGFWKTLVDHLSDVGREVPSQLSRGDMGAAKEVMKEALGKAGGKTATSELESITGKDPGMTFTLPLSIGLQAGFWYLEIVQMDLVSYDGCKVCGSESARVRGF